MIKLKDLLSERTYVSNVKKVGKLQKWTIKKGGQKVDVLGSKKFFDDGRGFSTNDPDDALMLWNLGKKFKGIGLEKAGGSLTKMGQSARKAAIGGGGFVKQLAGMMGIMKKLIMVLNKLWSRVKLKLPV